MKKSLEFLCGFIALCKNMSCFFEKRENFGAGGFFLLPRNVFIFVGCKGKSIEKRILRDTLELVSSFVVCPWSVNGALSTGGRGVPIRFVNRFPLAPHSEGG
jgi:hypothetical protein